MVLRDTGEFIVEVMYNKKSPKSVGLWRCIYKEWYYSIYILNQMGIIDHLESIYNSFALHNLVNKETTTTPTIYVNDTINY
jgi:hypothetical protein